MKRGIKMKDNLDHIALLIDAETRFVKGIFYQSCGFLFV